MAAEIYEFVWYTNPFFMISLIIQGLATLLFGFTLGTYYFIWLPKYELKDGIRIKLDPKEWENKKCDIEFSRFVSEEKRKIEYY